MRGPGDTDARVNMKKNSGSRFLEDTNNDHGSGTAQFVWDSGAASCWLNSTTVFNSTHAMGVG